MRRLLAILLLLGGPAAASHQDASDAVEAAGAATQREMLRTLVVGAEHDCLEVSAVFFAGTDAEDAHHWDVLCRSGAAHRITFRHDPQQPVTVRDCSALTGMARCFEAADPRVPALRSPAARCVAICSMASAANRPACLDICLAAPAQEDDDH